jgi:hypothetical protein
MSKFAFSVHSALIGRCGATGITVGGGIGLCFGVWECVGEWLRLIDLTGEGIGVLVGPIRFVEWLAAFENVPTESIA